MPKMPFEKSFPMTQDWNDKRWRANYAKFNLMGHNGQDFGCPTGTPILAPHEGKIIEALFDAGGYGWYVKIENDKEGSVLAHFKESPKVKVGDCVKQGQEVGLSGSSGNSTGPHLHWGYYRFPRNREDGFNGYLNQTHWMNIDDHNYFDEYTETLASLNRTKDNYAVLEKKYVSDGQLSTEHIKNLQSTVAEQANQITNMNQTIKDMTLENKRLTDDSTALQKKIVDMTASNGIEIKRLASQVETERVRAEKAEKNAKELKQKLTENLKGYGWWTRLFSLFKK